MCATFGKIRRAQSSAHLDWSILPIHMSVPAWTAPKGLMGSLNNVGKWQSPARKTVKPLVQG